MEISYTGITNEDLMQQWADLDASERMIVQQTIAALRRARGGSFTYFEEMLDFRLVGMERNLYHYRMEMKECLCNCYRMMHGGAVATAFDTAMGRVARDRSQEGKMAVTTDLHIRYLVPIGIGETLDIHVSCLQQGRSVSVFQGEMNNEDQVLVAYASATFFQRSSPSGKS
ncbi:PaaI family thioesterase [Pasteuria penetrans]|uniref:PaaI family thioesterase n=1 Tax=Pasteuria penetrans TaxID=86005 RepID=UPI000F932EAF|nr:PaaI family thioesterase [Pasteuria penetrans]